MENVLGSLASVPSSPQPSSSSVLAQGHKRTSLAAEPAAAPAAPPAIYPRDFSQPLNLGVVKGGKDKDPCPALKQEVFAWFNYGTALADWPKVPNRLEAGQACVANRKPAAAVKVCTSPELCRDWKCDYGVCGYLKWCKDAMLFTPPPGTVGLPYPDKAAPAAHACKCWPTIADPVELRERYLPAPFSSRFIMWGRRGQRTWEGGWGGERAKGGTK